MPLPGVSGPFEQPTTQTGFKTRLGALVQQALAPYKAQLTELAGNRVVSGVALFGRLPFNHLCLRAISFEHLRILLAAAQKHASSGHKGDFSLDSGFVKVERSESGGEKSSFTRAQSTETSTVKRTQSNERSTLPRSKSNEKLKDKVKSNSRFRPKLKCVFSCVCVCCSRADSDPNAGVILLLGFLSDTLCVQNMSLSGDHLTTKVIVPGLIEALMPLSTSKGVVTVISDEREAQTIQKLSITVCMISS